MDRLTDDHEWDRLLAGLEAAGDPLEGFTATELAEIAQGIAEYMGEVDSSKGGEKMGSVAQTQAVGEPWERRQGESAKAYEAFCIYRDLGANRSHAKVAAQLRKSTTLIGRWGGEHKWSERVGAWDRFLAEEQRKAHVEAVKKMEERHARLGEGMQTLAARKLQRMLERTDPNKSSKQEADAALDGIEMHDMRALIKDGTGLERVARGEPETITVERVEHTWADAIVQRRREREEREQAEQVEPKGDVTAGAHDDADGGGSGG